ncbi:Photosystem I reaction center subunit XI [Neosynechococcus sphagnicola sy1]|uniref:Photosystem I reaction center subunit XI n=1 Tax=Neosynechococcus sphagnicola sy1 TaxID=1497020 RepID=A0A098TK23_9CYAN|nr:photosystem I reaction center protein subunit XI [Neosynechococcus sphagnicola]KGF72192.1 Photosystem I reaction center subunit XI [Neosynechococcus sphagnicola sy1]
MAEELIKPYKGDPFVGHLATPISASAFTETFISNLPAYRTGLSPILRGLEVGLAHGYFLIGPWVKLGPLRDSDFAALGGLISGLALIIIATACLSLHGLVSFQGGSKWDVLHNIPPGGKVMQSAEGWSQFTGGFFIGATGSAFVAYFLLANFAVVDSIFRGVFN